MHTMKQSRIVVAWTLAAACLAFGGSSATVAAAEKSRTLRARGGGGGHTQRGVQQRRVLGARERNEPGAHDSQPRRLQITAERKTDYSAITREDWTCKVKFTYRTGPSEAELELRRQHEEFVERTERENPRLMQEAHDAQYGTDR